MAERRDISCGCEHDFALVLTGVNDLTQELEDALFEAGCDDATLSLRSGRVYLTFSRTAGSLMDAIISAVQNVRQANIGASVLRVDTCNLVTQAEIARKIGRSRQLIHQYITGKRGPGNFPAPVCFLVDDAPLYAWCEVSYWLWRNGMVREQIAREAEEVEIINHLLGLQNLKQTSPEVVDEILRSLAEPDAMNPA